MDFTAEAAAELAQTQRVHKGRAGEEPWSWWVCRGSWAAHSPSLLEMVKSVLQQVGFWDLRRKSSCPVEAKGTVQSLQREGHAVLPGADYGAGCVHLQLQKQTVLCAEAADTRRKSTLLCSFFFCSIWS